MDRRMCACEGRRFAYQLEGSNVSTRRKWHKRATQHLPGKGMSSISSAQEPKSTAISHVPVRLEVSEPTLVGQEVPEGHLLGLLLSGRYTKPYVSIRSPNGVPWRKAADIGWAVGGVETNP
jgi:hypothetical protein